MTKNNKYEVELIDVDSFKVLHICSSPPRLEAKVIFDRDHISQKLIFTLMEIAHAYGFGCSPPRFGGSDDPSMTFLIGTILPSKRSINKYVKKMKDCLIKIQIFADSFSKQLDFTILDLSMFGGIDLTGFYPEHLAALKDQHHNGSWEEFHDTMILEEREDEADMIRCCMEFEKINAKDVGFVGHKLGYMLHMLEQVPLIDDETN